VLAFWYCAKCANSVTDQASIRDQLAAMRLLLIEDDQRSANFIIRGLNECDHVVDHATTGKNGLYMAISEKYDALVVDRMLPEIDGLTIVKTVRSTGNLVPVVFLTTMARIDDRVEGLEAGADDYLVKPFAFTELVARLNAVTRRVPAGNVKTVFQVADLKMDLVTREVSRGNRTIELQPQEFRLLEYLLRNDGKIVTKTMLLEKVWGFRFDPQTSVVETHLSRLRAKIDRGFDCELIHTIRGSGYCVRYVHQTDKNLEL
jgi:two-component system, OmpR family, response regulator